MGKLAEDECKVQIILRPKPHSKKSMNKVSKPTKNQESAFKFFEPLDLALMVRTDP
ncbi:hypothetical protein Csa_021309 [Cucumis sativus]|nr:hypothetical protein Csa_021309 [Cucumis sativus]